jgi:hypothetical protein
MTSQAVLKEFCNQMEVSLNRRETMSGVMSKYVLATVASPKILYLNPHQTVSSDKVQYTNSFRRKSQFKLFFF